MAAEIVEIKNGPLVVTFKHQKAKQGTHSFLENVRFTVCDSLYSEPADVCTDGAYLACLGREILGIESQVVEYNEHLVSEMFGALANKFNAILWGSEIVNNSVEFDLQNLRTFCVLNGPEPFDGFLSYLVRLGQFDLFMGQKPNSESDGLELRFLPSCMYLKHLKQIRAAIVARNPESGTMGT